MSQILSHRQIAHQIQSQRMGANQIQRLKMLAMSALELREEILVQAEKNPALEIEDDFEDEKMRAKDFLGAKNIAPLADARSNAFLEILEKTADERESLYSHLMKQLSFLRISKKEKNLCEKIISNLDEKGFFVFAPASLLGANEPQRLLERCLNIVRDFDPPGICVANSSESLLLQAKKKAASPCVIFLLSGHLDFLSPPIAQKVLKKIRSFLKAQKTLAFSNEDFSFLKKISVFEIQSAIDFIKSLDPFPARFFSSKKTHYIAGDIIVQKIPFSVKKIDLAKLRVPLSENYSFKITLAKGMLPRAKISSAFLDVKNSSTFAQAALRQATAFLESLEFRKSAIAHTACVLVQMQKDFFKNGPGHLLPLRERDVARAIGVHESTVSRIALSKYIQCEWGLFPVKYFFSNCVSCSKKINEKKIFQKMPVSQERAKAAIKKILLESDAQKKPLSDQKIADLLLAQGIKIARRTVAKYRAQLNINSSYERSGEKIAL